MKNIILIILSMAPLLAENCIEIFYIPFTSETFNSIREDTIDAKHIAKHGYVKVSDEEYSYLTEVTRRKNNLKIINDYKIRAKILIDSNTLIVDKNGVVKTENHQSRLEKRLFLSLRDKFDIFYYQNLDKDLLQEINLNPRIKLKDIECSASSIQTLRFAERNRD